MGRDAEFYRELAKVAEFYRATLPHFCCGFDVIDGKIVEAAPIMRWAVGRSLAEFVRWAEGKGGKVERI